MTPKMTSVSVADLAMPLMRRLDPERAHDCALLALRLGLAGTAALPADPALEVSALGCRFRTPIGLAAGFDKNGVAVAPLMRLGFGFVEAGTVTPLPQPGNPRPRLFRLEADQGVVNRFGFNNDGVEALIARAVRHGTLPAPFGINIGINKDNADPEADYPFLVSRVAPHADYVALNVSSPNTPGLRSLQSGERIRAILAAIAKSCPSRPKLLIKLSPDLSDAELHDAVEAALDGGVDGLIMSNTTLSRPPDLQSRDGAQAGGLSGRPLRARAMQMLRATRRLTQGRIVLIGCGGIGSGRDILDRVRAGANLVQIYTAFSYAGPSLLPRLAAELSEALRADGLASVAEACGVDA